MSGGVLATILGLALLLPPAILVPSTLRVRGALEVVIAGLVAAAGSVVAVATAVSLVGSWNLEWALAGQAVVAAAVIVVWLLTGRAHPPRPRLPGGRRVLAAARREPLVALLAGAALVALPVQFWQALEVVSNAWDPLAYHLSRAAFWIQEESVTQFVGGTPRQLGYPPNAEIIVSWSMLVAGGDALANLVQWIAWPASGAGVYALARLLRFERAPSLLAAAFFVVMPIPVMQATTAQNDLVATFFVLSAVLFGVRGLRDGHRGELAVGAAALALALGTKGIVLVAGPSLVLVAGVLVWRSGVARRMLPLGAAMLVGALLAFTAYNFVLNVRNTGDLYGGARAGTERTSPYLDNLALVGWQFVDMPGIDIFWLKTISERWADDLLGVPGAKLAPDSRVDDSQSAFGLLVPLFLLPIVVGYLIRRRSAPDRRLAAAAVLLFALVFPLAAQDNPDLGRLAAPGVAAGSALLAVVHRRPVISAFAVAVALLGFLPALLANGYKPLVVPEGALPAHRQHREGQLTYGRADISGVIETLRQHVRDDEPIGFVGGSHAWDYPFFGPHLERRVERAGEGSWVTPAEVRRRGLAAVVLEHAEPAPGVKPIRLSEAFSMVLPAR